MEFFTADQHFFHNNIIKYCDRPFKNYKEMHDTLVSNHNSVVKQTDTVYHLGDFAMSASYDKVINVVQQLNGIHFFIMGSHDKWLERLVKTNNYAEDVYNNIIHYRGRRIEITIKNKFISMDHYCQKTWARSHYNSYHLFGHSHGRLLPVGKSWDVGVDNNNFYPISFDQIKEIMDKREDNPNKVDDKPNFFIKN